MSSAASVDVIKKEEEEVGRAEKEEKELTPYRPSEWPLKTFQEKISDPKFAEYAYEAHTIIDQQQQLKLNELYPKLISKIPKSVIRLNIWGGADEYNHGGGGGNNSAGGGAGGGGALTLLNIFHNEEMFKGVLRAILIGEAVGYEKSIQRLTECGTYLNQIGHYDEPDITKKTEEGFLIEVAIQLYYQAVYVTDQHEIIQTNLEQEWEEYHHSNNKVAYQQILRHIPHNIQEIPSEQVLIELTSPTGDKLPKLIARRLFRKNILQILRFRGESGQTFIERVHPIWLEERFISNGLTLTEHRALQYYLRGLKQIFRDRLTFDGGGGGGEEKRNTSNNNTEQNIYKRKYQWLQMLENNFKDSLSKQQQQEKASSGGTTNTASSSKKEAIDYSGDYGWYDPDDDDDDAKKNVVTTKEVLDDLGYNDINSKMMKQWLDKPSSSTNTNTTTNDESLKPMPPRLPMGNLLLGIQKKAGGGKNE